MNPYDLQAYELIKNNFVQNKIMNRYDDELPYEPIDPEIKDQIYEIAEENRKSAKNLFNHVIKSDNALLEYLNGEYGKYYRDEFP